MIETKTTKKNKTSFFLPYQVRWLNDKSKVKIWEKSRRIGATYVQSYEDVRDCVKRTVPAVWFSSADESAADAGSAIEKSIMRASISANDFLNILCPPLCFVALKATFYLIIATIYSHFNTQKIFRDFVYFQRKILSKMP